MPDRRARRLNIVPITLDEHYRKCPAWALEFRNFAQRPREDAFREFQPRNICRLPSPAGGAHRVQIES